MENIHYNKDSKKANDRQFAKWASIAIGVLLAIKLFRLLSGHGHWDVLWLGIAILIMQLTQFLQLKGLAKLFSQIITWGLLGLMIVMFIVHR